MHKWEEVFVLYDVGRLGVGSRTSGEREALETQRNPDADAQENQVASAPAPCNRLGMNGFNQTTDFRLSVFVARFQT